MECDKVENRTLETEWALTILNFFENHPALIPNTHFGEKELRKGGGRGGGGGVAAKYLTVSQIHFCQKMWILESSKC